VHGSSQWMEWKSPQWMKLKQSCHVLPKTKPRRVHCSWHTVISEMALLNRGIPQINSDQLNHRYTFDNVGIMTQEECDILGLHDSHVVSMTSLMMGGHKHDHNCKQTHSKNLAASGRLGQVEAIGIHSIRSVCNTAHVWQSVPDYQKVSSI
jgi:hypothetical protein